MSMYNDEEGRIGVEPEIEEPVLEAGTNPGDLFTETEEKTLEIVHKNKKWVFKYKDLSWKDKYDCVDAAASIEGEDFSFSLSRYYMTALGKMLTHSPIQPLTETTISRLDKDVGAQLISIVPPPADEAVISGLKKA